VLVIGVIWGSISVMSAAGDLVMMRIVDVIYALPDMLIIILLSVVLDSLLSASRIGIVDSARLKHAVYFYRLRSAVLGRYGQAYTRQILTIKSNDYI
jgi:oligopeptide transport system permease protein